MVLQLSVFGSTLFLGDWILSVRDKGPGIRSLMSVLEAKLIGLRVQGLGIGVGIRCSTELTKYIGGV